MSETRHFRVVLGNNPTIKIIEFFLTYDETDWNLMHIDQSLDVSYSSLKEIIPKLVDLQILYVTRQIGKANMYALNKRSPVVQSLRRSQGEINKQLDSLLS